MASVRQLTTPNREGKRPWVVEYTDPAGKRRRATPPSGLKKDAEKLRQKIEREIEEGRHKPDSETRTIAQAIAVWQIDLERRREIGDRMAGGTFYTVSHIIKNHLLPTFGGYKLTDIKTTLVQDWIDKIIVRHSRGFVLRIFQIFYQLLEFSVRKEWLTVHPLVSNRVRIPNKDEKKKQIPSTEQMSQLLAYLVAPKRAKQHHEQIWCRLLAVTINLFTGMRRGEVCGLQWENVDLADRMIYVRHSYSDFDGLKSTKTAAGVRSIPMCEPVFAILNEWRLRCGGNPTGYVLLRMGNPVSPKKMSVWFWNMMRDMGWVDATGKPLYSMHTLRHCAVSLLLKEGLALMHIQRVIGHASFKTTMDVYGHLLPGDDSSRKAMDNIAGRFTAATPKLENFAVVAPMSHADVDLARNERKKRERAVARAERKRTKAATRQERDIRGKALMIAAT